MNTRPTLTERAKASHEHCPGSTFTAGGFAYRTTCTCCHSGCDCGCRDECPAFRAYLRATTERKKR